MVIAPIAPMAVQLVTVSSTWIDETVTVNELGWRYWFGTWMSGETAEVSIQVTSGGGISFYIMDENNYNIWNSGGTPSLSVSRLDVMNADFNWSASTTQRYYFLLDNTDSFSSVTVHIRVLRYVQGGNGVEIVDLGILAAIGIVVGIAVVAGLSYMRTRGKPSATAAVKPAFKPRPSGPSSVQVQAVFCANCGASIPPGAGFCPNCGSPTTRRY